MQHDPADAQARAPSDGRVAHGPLRSRAPRTPVPQWASREHEGSSRERVSHTRHFPLHPRMFCFPVSTRGPSSWAEGEEAHRP